ncbi:MAG: flagellar basal-body rod protein FlgG [Rhodospirillales bacterium]|nr:flagellar basal-body rod protein FlgG [Rhodospirillales bacterium]MDH3790377.1 flagellar basal-body rod protein FlgG [Rhodospirillales bacterium]MDH3920907.1 flagellar basal-body rod protein FlgG [Rhodospirillales bacterium]MDH3965567.1 flagellar basal-body rod protein FlgG [Rhodospirillales bacterium]
MLSLDIAATGMLAQQLNVEVISNNIANMNTTGYKRQRAEFQDLLYQDLLRVGSASSDAGTVVPAGIQVGLGVQPAAVYRISEQGSMQITENPFDLAINGKGYFMVELPSGSTAYTRAGAFQLSADGDLVTPDGFVIQPGITIPTDAISVTVNASGQVWVTIDGQVNPQQVGQIELATFANQAGLEAIGDNLLLETVASGTATVGTPASAGFGSVEQGLLEASNVNVVAEITNLITAQRAYEMNSKVIQASDEMMSSVTQLR